MNLNHTPGASAPAAMTLHAWSADVFAARGLPAGGAVLAPVLARGAITLVTGPRGVGKSWLALGMALAAARGGALAGWRARLKQRVVYVDAGSGEALLRARLAALAPVAPPPSLVLAPGDAQVHGLPDLGTEAGRDALDRLAVDADLVVLDGLAALVQAGRGVGARWRALADWLRALRRRGIAVLLVEASEPRAIAALADTVLRLERPADPAAEAGVRFAVRIAASRALPADQCRGFALQLSLRAGGAVWTRHDDIDYRALAAWRLSQRKLSTREIARRLGVSPATAWRLVERGEAMPPHLRDREELPELEEERRAALAEERAAARREARWRAREAAWAEEERYTPLPNGEREGPARDSAWEGEGENTADDIDSPGRAIARPLTLTLSPLGRGDGGGADANSPEALKQPAAPDAANAPEAVKQAPSSIDDVATDDLVPVLLARRKWWKIEQAPPPDWLERFDYQTLFHAARNRLTSRRLNKLMLADDKRPFHPVRAPFLSSLSS